jgi:hypothetical protein
MGSNIVVVDGDVYIYQLSSAYQAPCSCKQTDGAKAVETDHRIRGSKSVRVHGKNSG